MSKIGQKKLAKVRVANFQVADVLNSGGVEEYSLLQSKSCTGDRDDGVIHFSTSMMAKDGSMSLRFQFHQIRSPVLAYNRSEMEQFQQFITQATLV